MTLTDWSTSTVPNVFARGKGHAAVEMSPELQRILDLPRRAAVDLGGKDEHGVLQPPSARALALVEIMTARLTRGSRACACASMGRPCITSLLPAQAWALYEAPLAGGITGFIGVGHGKTGLDILIAMVMLAAGETAVLLLPPGLVVQFEADYLRWAEHFRVPSLVLPSGKVYMIVGRPVLRVIPYSKLSRPESTDLLRQLKPRLVISDEAHRLRHPDTSTTGRVLRMFEDAPDTMLCDWSGTLLGDSIRNVAHLLALSLHDGSPLPLEPAELEAWAAVVDPSEFAAPRGELERLCSKDETLYQGIHRRLVSTRGVISTKAGAIDAEINLEERTPKPGMPVELRRMIDIVRDTAVRPDGEEFVESLEKVACLKQMAQGFYLRWKFPHGEPPALIEEWRARRKAYHHEGRLALKDRAEHLDSPQLLARAAARAYQVPAYKGELPVWESETWEAWVAIKDRVYHETEAVWVDDYLARDAAAWGKKHQGIIWYEHSAIGERIAQLSGLPMYGGGAENAAAIVREKGKRSVIASIKAHGTGRDGLQLIWREQLVVSPPSSGDTWEQLLGRLHRLGFTHDEVMTYVYRHTDEMADAIDRALIKAKFIDGITGTWQKLLVANVSFDLKNT